MTRFADPANETESDKYRQSIGLMVSLDFASGVVRATNRAHDVTFGGNTYTGIGQFGSIDVIREDGELRPYSLTLMLSGVDNSLLSRVLDEDYHGRAAVIYAGWFDANDQLVADPHLVFKGDMDHVSITLGELSGTIRLVCENEWARWGLAQLLMYTHETQQVFYPGDRFFDQVPYQKSKTVRWGGGRVLSPPDGDGGRGGGPRRNPGHYEQP